MSMADDEYIDALIAVEGADAEIRHVTNWDEVRRIASVTVWDDDGRGNRTPVNAGAQLRAQRLLAALDRKIKELSELDREVLTHVTGACNAVVFDRLGQLGLVRYNKDGRPERTQLGHEVVRCLLTENSMPWEPYEHTKIGWMMELEYGGVSVAVESGGYFAWEAFTGFSEARGTSIDVERSKRFAVTAYSLLVRLEGNVPDAGIQELAQIATGEE